MERDAYEWTYCVHTGKEKPPRAHYDHITEKLVLNMDHYWCVRLVSLSLSRSVCPSVSLSLCLSVSLSLCLSQPVRTHPWMTNLCCVGGIVRAFKTLRLLRLAKLLRVARIKKMLEKYEDQFDANQYLGLLFTLFSTRSVQCICDTCV